MKAEEDQGGRILTLHLASAGPSVPLASSVLARGLGIPQDAATEILLAAPRALPALPAARARRLRSVLACLGVRLDLTPADGTRHGVTIALQPRAWADASRLSRSIAAVIGGTSDRQHAALAQPGGLVLHDVLHETAPRLERRLARIRGLRILRDDDPTPLADLFPTRRLTDEEISHLARLRRRLDLSADRVMGAALARLPVRLASRLARESLAGLGLIEVRQAFQRFDLYLTGQTGWMEKDLADFLVARTGQSRGRFESLSPADPVRLDLDLPPATARRFMADYAAIGLFTRPVLRGLSRDLENPIP